MNDRWRMDCLACHKRFRKYRGLCLGCYDRTRVAIRLGEVTETDLIRRGKMLPAIKPVLPPQIAEILTPKGKRNA